MLLLLQEQATLQLNRSQPRFAARRNSRSTSYQPSGGNPAAFRSAFDPREHKPLRADECHPGSDTDSDGICRSDMRPLETVNACYALKLTLNEVHSNRCICIKKEVSC